MSYVVDVLSRKEKRKEKKEKVIKEIAFNFINCPCS
jgi:hypothetical protein